MVQLSPTTHRSLLEMEEVLREIDASPPGNLAVTKDFASKRIGAFYDAARLQLLSTWARQSPRNLLQFHTANTVNGVLEEWCDYAPGIVALRLCEGISVGEEVVDRREALEPAAFKMLRTDSLDFEKLIKGRSLDFTCVSGAKIQYLRPLFHARDASSVKGKQEMFDLVQKLNSEVSQLDEFRVPKVFLEACSVFASELIRNTQEHATKDCYGRPYIEHAEGFIISWTQLEGDSYEQDFQGHPRLREFWKRETGAVRAEPLRSLQVSFFDTGPGIAGRATSRELSDLTPAAEREALLRSLKKNASTKRETGAGNGYPEVLERLRQVGGLMSIRTGRLRLFQAFSPNEQRDLFAFDNWAEELLAPATGTVVSIILPIRR